MPRLSFTVFLGLVPAALAAQSPSVPPIQPVVGIAVGRGHATSLRSNGVTLIANGGVRISRSLGFFGEYTYWSASSGSSVSGASITTMLAGVALKAGDTDALIVRGALGQMAMRIGTDEFICEATCGPTRAAGLAVHLSAGYERKLTRGVAVQILGHVTRANPDGSSSIVHSVLRAGIVVLLDP